jgi:hypothetical protein
MTDELSEWFRHLATVETEMRRDIDIYMTEDETPLTFAVRLRTHPALRVTAAAKMRSAVTAASSYGGRRVQTHYFHTDAEWLRRNIAAARDLVAASVANSVRVEKRAGEGRYIFRDVPYDIVTRFLGSYQFHEKSPENDADLISAYIQKRVSAAGSLRRWNVAIVGTPNGQSFSFAPNVTVGCNVRSRLATDLGPGSVDIKTLMSPRDAAVDLSPSAVKLDEDGIRKKRKEEFPDTGLLVLYPIDKNSQPKPEKKTRAPLNTEEHVIGVGLVFPETRDGDSTVEKYISADLSGVRIEDEDFSILESEDV